jgi:hypothetical protein
MRSVLGGLAVTAALVSGCGGGTTGATADGTGGVSDSLTTAQTMSAPGAESDTTMNASASADATAGPTSPDVTGPGETNEPDGSGTTTSDTGSSDGDSSSTGDDGGNGACKGNGQPVEIEFSYIWIANSTEGTVSKINTFTGVEEGRYETSPESGPFDSADGPSRTSVNLLGDVAVANRNGGITKFAAETEDCIDNNGNLVIDTSTGPNDVLPWGEDECMLWHHPTPFVLAFNEGPRPIAWEANVDPVTCDPLPNPRLWFGYYDTLQNRGFFERLDGDSGAMLDAVDTAWNGLSWGPYGGAVNAEGDFWVIGWQLGPTIRIDSDTLVVQNVGAVPFDWYYGLALDADGDPWVGGLDLHHYDTAAGLWETFQFNQPYNFRGLQIDGQGRAFLAANSPCGLSVFDTINEVTITDFVQLPGCSEPVGVSIDVEGYVWVVDHAGWAYKIDPDNYQIQIQVTGLVNPYTYSDMTGAGLALQIQPS